jgi:hypothetical protein
MGFFRKHQQQKITVTLFEGGDVLEVVGESFHAENLELIVSQMAQPRHFVRDKLNLPVHAVLKAETDNHYDANAIAVLVGGRMVGHLSRENAAAYRPGLLRLEAQEGQPIALAGNIIGSDGGYGYGVFLKHDPEDFGLNTAFKTDNQTSQGARLRTGLSEAMLTDDADDTYDLDWMDELPSDTAKRIPKLRALLEEDPDAIDRHFMFTQLEKDLYACRDLWLTALDEYDEVAERHHDELVEGMRDALCAKFGSVPLIDTYRQAAIRAQKAKDWEASLRWAEQGLTIYGEDAAREDAVEDLQKRADKARDKLGNSEQ